MTSKRPGCFIITICPVTRCFSQWHVCHSKASFLSLSLCSCLTFVYNDIFVITRHPFCPSTSVSVWTQSLWLFSLPTTENLIEGMLFQDQKKTLTIWWIANWRPVHLQSSKTDITVGISSDVPITKKLF